MTCTDADERNLIAAASRLSVCGTVCQWRQLTNWERFVGREKHPMNVDVTTIGIQSGLRRRGRGSVGMEQPDSIRSTSRGYTSFVSGQAG